MAGRPFDEFSADTTRPVDLPIEPPPARELSEDPGLRRRRRVLLFAALASLLLVWWVARSLAIAPQIDAAWQATATGRYVLAYTREPALIGRMGDLLEAVIDDQGRSTAVDAILLQVPARWIVADDQRRARAASHRALARALQQPRLTLLFASGARISAEPQPLGYRALGGQFWLVSLIAVGLCLSGLSVMMARPQIRNVLFCGMMQAQAIALLISAVETVPGIGPPAMLSDTTLLLQMALDLFTACAIVHVCAVHPFRLDDARWVAGLAWAGTAGLLAIQWLWPTHALWWTVQIALMALGVVAIVLLAWSNRREAHPFAVVLRRFGVLALASLALLTFSVAFAGVAIDEQHGVAAIASLTWRVFFNVLLALLPFLSRSQHVMREFTMLAAVTCVAAAIDLLCVTLLSLGPFASLAVSLFAALALYVGIRHWMLQQLTRARVQTIERMFERLYVIARAMETNPERSGALLATLLREVFEPLESMPSTAEATEARVLDDGAALLVPVPQLQPRPRQGSETQVLRFAGNGTRLFTRDDARLANRLVEQLKRAITFDRAVEQGRSEERIRLAQDLHDDIGARLLTLMYQAPSKEMENYLRHTLQDLKTLTRGLAAPGHLISEAAAEWKADLSQRLEAVPMDLNWSFDADADPLLGVVQWSSLTRIVRELATNAIAHSMASHVDVRISLRGHLMTLVFSDNGVGREPQGWSHGLGLGGVRKRVKLLGGRVEWREQPTGGIVCTVVIPDVGAAG